MSVPVRKTPARWVHDLTLENEPVTLEEFQAACQSRQLGALADIADSNRHIEGMLGAADVFLAALAQLMGVPYPASQEVRAALAEHRQRKALEMSGGEVRNDADEAA